MPRKRCSPRGINAVVVSAATVPETSTVRPSGPAQPFEPADEVDCWPDRGEVQPVGGADIAPQHFAEMQGHAEG